MCAICQRICHEHTWWLDEQKKNQLPYYFDCIRRRWSKVVTSRPAPVRFHYHPLLTAKPARISG